MNKREKERLKRDKERLERDKKRQLRIGATNNIHGFTNNNNLESVELNKNKNIGSISAMSQLNCYLNLNNNFENNLFN